MFDAGRRAESKDMVDVTDKRPGRVGFSPRGVVIFRETWAEAHVTASFVGHVMVEFADHVVCASLVGKAFRRTALFALERRQGVLRRLPRMCRLHLLCRGTGPRFPFGW